MTRRIVIFGVAAVFALGLVTASAQDRTPPTQDTGGAGSRGGGAATGGGGGGGGAATSSSSGGGGVNSGGSSSIGGTSWGETRPTGDFGGRRLAAPLRYDGGDGGQRAVPRGGGNGGSSGGDRGGRERAVPRGDSGGSRGGGNDRAAGRMGSTPSIDDSPGRQRNPVPAYSRPREGRTVVGTAVQRTDGYRGGTVYPYYYDSWYGSPYFGYSSYYRYGFPGYGYGLGYFYDPFFFGYGYGYPYGGYGGYYGGGGGYYGGGAGYYSRYDTGSLRLKIKPSDAKVYVDGYFVGVVDSFDGVFQRLTIDAGSHRVEVRADGYEPVQFEVMITPGETVTYKGEMKRSIR